MRHGCDRSDKKVFRCVTSILLFGIIALYSWLAYLLGLRQTALLFILTAFTILVFIAGYTARMVIAERAYGQEVARKYILRINTIKQARDEEMQTKITKTEQRNEHQA